MDRREFNKLTVAGLFGVGVSPLLQAFNSSNVSARRKAGNNLPIGVRDRKQLFIDQKFIDASQGLQLQVNSPCKCEKIIQSEIPGLTRGGYLSVVRHDGKYWAYQSANLPSSNDEDKPWTMCVSQSQDGIHWEDPVVGRFEIQGSRNNNVVMISANGAVFLDPKMTNGSPFWFIGIFKERTTPPYWDGNKNTYYKGRTGGGVYLAHSKDGLHWNRQPGVALPFWCDTQNQCFYDHRIGKYVAYVRGHGPNYEHSKRRIVCRAEGDSLTDLPWPYQENPDRERGPQGLFSRLYDELPEVMGPDHLDPPETDVYHPSVNIYPWAEDAYLAFPSVYRHYDGQNSHGRDLRGELSNSGPLEGQLAVSRDGVDFHRFRQPYIAPGLLEDPEQGGTLYIGVGMVRDGNKIYQYFSQNPYPHGPATHIGRGTVEMEDARNTLWRAEQRLDGFVSVDAGPEGGEFITPPVQFEGNRLELNANCGAMGEVWVEIQDSNGRPIPGYSMEQAVSVDRNGIAQEVWWQDGPDVAKLAGKSICLHIKMRSSKLYAFQFRNR